MNPAIHKLIKAYIGKNFSVELYETAGGNYVIQTVEDDKPVKFSSTFNDYRLASQVFETKIQELEGN